MNPAFAVFINNPVLTLAAIVFGGALVMLFAPIAWVGVLVGLGYVCVRIYDNHRRLAAAGPSRIAPPPVPPSTGIVDHASVLDDKPTSPAAPKAPTQGLASLLTELEASSAATQPAAGPTLEEILADIAGMTGLAAIKKQLATFVQNQQVEAARRAQGLAVASTMYHSRFIGPPGTGKTVVARKFAAALKAMGLVSKGHLVETDRAGLVAEYQGQTAKKTLEKIDAATGGILFIDEAYTLVQGQGDSFGKEALDTLLKQMTDRKDFVVILAGYREDIDKLLLANSGMTSRLPFTFEFESYSPDELYKIIRGMAGKAGNKFAPDTETVLKAAIRHLYDRRDERRWANAREMEQLEARIRLSQSSRLAKSGRLGDIESLTTYTVDDVRAGAKDRGVEV